MVKRKDLRTDETLRGRTMSQSGPAYFTRCVKCKRLVMANEMYAGPDFTGDGAARWIYPVVCSECVREEK